MSSFTKAQSSAIHHLDGPLLVLAGPGSGKTTVVTKRVQYMVQECGIAPSSILVITFTKAAATEMKERFLRLMSSESCAPKEYGNVSFGTFHAIFFHILRLAYGFTGASILREEQRYRYIRESVEKQKLEIDDENEFISGILGEISLMKNERIDISTYFSKNCSEAIFRKLYEEYEEKKRRARLIDFDDMLVYTYELLTKRPDILSAWQKKYQYILVDEFQDINQLQYDILKLLALPQNHLFVVGDDDQSIYRFRGARPEIMLHFKKDYPDAKEILLRDNFRSTREIVEASMRVIRHNKERFDKEIVARGGEGAPVRILTFSDQQQECLYLLKEVQDWLRTGHALADAAVIYRTNTQPRLLVQKLMEYNVPFSMGEQMPNLFEHWIAKNIFCYMRLAMGSNQRADLIPILNRPKRYLSRECLGGESIDWGGMLSYYKGKAYVCERIDRLRYDLKMLGRMSPFAAVNYIRNVIGYEDYLREYASFRRMKDEELLDVLSELQESARGFKSYEDWFSHIEKYKREMEEMKRRQQSRPEGLRLTTMHSSKGLEYEKVWILDATEGVTPYRKAILDADIEEERRMFYVALTRAKKELVVCWAKKQGNHELGISRFVEEMKDGHSL